MNQPVTSKLAAQAVAVLPCLNERATIGALTAAVAQQLRPALPQPRTDDAARAAGLAQSAVLVVDDGSNDGTGAAAADAGAIVLRHERTQGKGAAVQTGLQEAWRLGYPWALLMDGDGQHAPADIPAFFACAEATGADLVVGNRMGQARSMPWVRRQVNRWMSRRLSRLAGQLLPDSQCGFRLVHLPAWAALTFATQHFEIESEMLLKFIRAGRRVEFVPIDVIYKSEQSKIHPWRDTLRWFGWLRRWPS